jgi:hypothetical protein
VLLFDIKNHTRTLLAKEARIEVITEFEQNGTADAVKRNTTQSVGKPSNSVYRSENASFRGEQIHDSIARVASSS